MNYAANGTEKKQFLINLIKYDVFVSSVDCTSFFIVLGRSHTKSRFIYIFSILFHNFRAH